MAGHTFRLPHFSWKKSVTGVKVEYYKVKTSDKWGNF